MNNVEQLEKQTNNVIDNALNNSKSLEEQSGFAILSGDAKIIHDLIESSMRLLKTLKTLKKECETVNELKAVIAKLQKTGDEKC
jgi:phage shock protein A